MSLEASLALASSRHRNTELAPCVTVKAGPVNPQMEAMRVAIMLPMLDV